MYIRQLNNPARDFTMVPNRLMRVGLSVEAVGFMMYVASLPASDIRCSQIEGATGLKEYKRQRIQRELQAQGLMHVVREPLSNGRWVTIYVFDWDALCDGPQARKRHTVPREPEPEIVIEPQENKAPAPETQNRPSVKTPPVDKSPAPNRENPGPASKTTVYRRRENHGVSQEEARAADAASQREAAARAANKVQGKSEAETPEDLEKRRKYAASVMREYGFTKKRP